MEIPERDLPLFLLNTVLFPRMPLPLHIFEPRYREMIARCLQERIGFGVLLIKEGDEVGGTAEPFSVGTIARIVNTQPLDDGRFNLLTLGVVRFRVLHTHSDQSYLTGDIRRWADEMGETSTLPKLTRAAHKAFVEYVAALGELADEAEGTGQVKAPFDPQVLSYTIGANLQISNEEKQALLEAETVQARLQQELVLLEREREFLRRVKLMREQLPRYDDGVFSKN
jgi:Lon protease-like protein